MEERLRRLAVVAATAGILQALAVASAFGQSTSGHIDEIALKSLSVNERVLELTGRSLEIGGQVLEIVGRVLAPQIRETPKEVHIELPADILFDFDKSDIRPSAAAALHQAAELIRPARSTVAIDGHTDGKGTPAYNQKLSDQRAESVRGWLAEKEGLKSIKFKTRGFG